MRGWGDAASASTTRGHLAPVLTSSTRSDATASTVREAVTAAGELRGKQSRRSVSALRHSRTPCIADGCAGAPRASPKALPQCSVHARLAG